MVTGQDNFREYHNRLTVQDSLFPKIKEIRSKIVRFRPGHTPLQLLIDENTIQKGISREYDNAGTIITGEILLFLVVDDRVLSLSAFFAKKSFNPVSFYSRVARDYVLLQTRWSSGFRA
jgi:hypothetical protein